MKKRVIISRNLVKNDNLFRLSAASDVGLVLYRPTNANQATAGRSSHKMAIHTLTSTPVICLDHRSFREVIDKYHCGIYIKDVRETKKALDKIFSNYSFFKTGAMDAYKNVYCLDNYIGALVEEINKAS
jgi:hypothetical protein